MTLSIDLSVEELEKILLGDRGKDLIMEKVFNQILQAEMSDHLGADRYERSEDRTGYRNGSYERELTTRVGQLTLEVPRCKDGSFSTKLFERYQRSEKALVLALMEWGLPRRLYPPDQEDHHRALRTRILEIDRFSAYKAARQAGQSLGRAAP